MQNTNCRGCVHWRIVGCDSSYRVCHYLEDTGLPRRCAADACPHKQTALPVFPPQPGPQALHRGSAPFCCACGEPITSAMLDVTDVARLPWQYAFLHADAQCRRVFVQEHRDQCLAFFFDEVDRFLAERLSSLVTRP